MLKKINTSKLRINEIVLIISLIFYSIYVYFINNISQNKDYNNEIFLLSWLGIIVGVYIIITWYKKTGKIFSLYTIFMFFFLIFNYGQCFLWAFGIHKPYEIGKTTLYTLEIPNSIDIIISQLIILTSVMMFHLGAIFCYKKKNNENVNKNSTILAIYKTSIISSFIIIPITFYNVIYKFIISQKHGYISLYYGENVWNGIAIFNLIEYMFFPCLVGFLIGSNYKKNVKIFVYIIFIIYIMFSLLSGDRGSWIFKLIILIWMSHTFYKPINLKKMIKYSFFSTIGLYIIDSIVAIRDIGINFENFFKAIMERGSVLVSSIFEMGSSMRPTIVLVKYGYDIWPYGNTYINALLGMVTNSTLTIFGIPFKPVSSWFSQEYLGISYGAGFSIVAEALLNYGLIIAPIFMILLGYIISSLTFLDKESEIENQPLKIFFSISSMEIIINIVRNPSQWIVQGWFYGVVIFAIMILFFRKK